MSLTIEPLESVGIEVKGFDITQAYTDALCEELKALWFEHGLLIFRDQPINPERQIEFSRLFGTLEMHPLKATTSEKYPELFELVSGGDNDKMMSAIYDGEEIVGKLDWHIDLNYTAAPNLGAVLTAVEVPAQDGLTGFGDRAKAYEALDDQTKALLANIEVVYTFMMQRKYWRYVDSSGYENPNGPKKPEDARFPNFPEAVYPAVVEHPISGKKILAVVEQFLDRVLAPQRADLSFDEAAELLWKLVDHVRQPEFTYFHHWREGDMVLWDNWRYMHCATGTKPGVRRVINRTTIEGGVQLGRVLEA